VPYTAYLMHPKRFKGMKICVSGGGEVALDCALTAKKNGAAEVEMFVRRRRSDMRIMGRDQEELEQAGVTVRELSSVTKIVLQNGNLCLDVVSNRINDEGKAEACDGTERQLAGYDVVIQALGAYYPKDKIPAGSVTAGDMTGTCGTVVQALASGRAAAQRVIAEAVQ
jgi:glutamate synthase (NADPH/NADH) small chain